MHRNEYYIPSPPPYLSALRIFHFGSVSELVSILVCLL